MRSRRSVATMLLLVVAVLGRPVPAGAQTSWGRGTGLTVAAGAAKDGGSWNGLFGGAVLWELTPYFAIEGAGRWIDRGIASSAFAGEVSALFGLGGTRDSFVPYLLAGVGFHRRMFDEASRAAAPTFYGRRFRDAGVFGARESFTDPTLVVGTGVDVALSRNVVVRPDVRVLIAVNDGRRHPVGVASIALGYRFEHKPVTPSRR